MMSIDAKISELQLKLQAIQGELHMAQARKAALEVLPPEHRLAIDLYEKYGCKLDRDSAWAYEMDREGEHQWHGAMHAAMLKKAKQMMTVIGSAQCRRILEILFT